MHPRGFLFLRQVLLVVFFWGVVSHPVMAKENLTKKSLAEKEQAWLEKLYQAGDDFRTESEILRFIKARPSHPGVGAARLLRAKIYYRQGRYREANLFLFSLLDDPRRRNVSEEAARLLGLSLARSGQTKEAATYLPREMAPPTGPVEGRVSPESARSWSTWVPGAGFFLLGQPQKATTALALNLLFTGAAVTAWNEGLKGAAFLSLLVEYYLYSGGRTSVFEAAEAHNLRKNRERLNVWAAGAGEGEILKVGVSLRF